MCLAIPGKPWKLLATLAELLRLLVDDGCHSDSWRYFALLQNEVNAIKWDPSGMLLASCSDDMTLKVSPFLGSQQLVCLLGTRGQVSEHLTGDSIAPFIPDVFL